MDGIELTLEPSTGLWLRSDGAKFIRNEFRPDQHVWIDVSTDAWTFSFGGLAVRMNWLAGGLPRSLIDDLQTLARVHVRTKAPTWIQSLRRLLPALSRLADTESIDLSSGLGSLSAAQWLRIWEGLTFESRQTLRFLYREMVDASMQGARLEIVQELDEWIAWPQPDGMHDVLTWNVQRGALTSAEAELARRLFTTSSDGETAVDEVTRVWGWMLFETYKRPSQLLEMENDALVEIPGQRPQFFLRIPKVKAQTGQSAELWPVSVSLAGAIRSVSSRPVINELQRHFNRLVVLPGRKRSPGGKCSSWDAAEFGLEVPAEWHRHGRVPSARMVRALDDFIEKSATISPRTGQALRVGAKRIRHTGGTSLANQGVPLDDIQTIFEHDDPTSSQAYIDAVGSELIPAMERADRALGGLFAGLNAAFFHGKLVNDASSRPILVPDFQGVPAVVGSCGRGSACPTNPFWACYGGCPNFQAWRKADHQIALRFVAREHERWSAAEAGKVRSKLGKDFERTYAGITEVIQAIASEAAG